jgi:predicted  nucleic acid-binding Zn-ribbon protein
MDIAYHIPNINLDWLLMGEEPMLKDGGNISNNDNALLLSLFEKEQSKNYTLCKEIGALQNELASKRKESEMLSKRISELQIDLKNVRDAYNATNDAKDSVQELPEVPAMLIPELNTEYINQKNK